MENASEISSQNLLISIFVPVFNGEKYLMQTLKSIQEQTYTNLEILLVDDSSTDESLKILNQFAKEDSRFKVFVKENGGMVAKSMNFILPKISGDYFFYSSQDDIFSKDLIEKMVQRQQETSADTILPEMEFYFENIENNKKIIGLNGDKNIELTGKDACVASLNWSIHGFALFKTILIQSEFFPEDAFDSDEYVTRKLFLKSNKVVFSEGIFYYRQDNKAAITKTFGTKNFYVLNSYWKLYQLLKNNNFQEEVVFKNQLEIMQRYLDIWSQFEMYKFESEESKNEIKALLIEHKKEQLNNEFFYHNFKYSLVNLKLRYLLLLLIIKNPFLFRIYMNSKNRRKLKSEHFNSHF